MADFLDLYLAVEAEDLGEVKRLLNQGHDIGEVDTETGINSLHLAIMTENYGIVELLSRDEAHINSTCSLRRAEYDSYTPLQLSVYVCNENITKLLLSRKANVNYQNKFGDTALHVAARCRLTKLFSLSNIEERATMNGYRDIAYILLQSGANVELVNEFEQTALHLACVLKYDTVARMILKKCSSIVNYRDYEFFTALHYAAGSDYNNYELVKLLIKYGADIDATDDIDSTPLSFACWKQKLNVVQVLVENGCNVNIGGKYSPFNSAVINCNVKIIKYLLKLGADTSHVFSIFNRPPPRMDYEIILVDSFYYVNSITITYIFEYRYPLDNNKHIVSSFEVFKLLLQHGCFRNIDRKNFSQRDTKFNCFIKYMIKMKTLGCFFSGDYPDIDASNIDILPDEEEYIENCKKEVEILREKFVCSDISLLDFLKKDFNKMVRLLNNQEIVNILLKYNNECSNYKILPIYGNLIKFFFRLGMERRSLLNRCYEWFNIIFCQYSELPFMVVENIFDFFTTHDLRMFTN